MRLTPALTILAVVLSSPALGAPKVGKYFCVIDYAAGISPRIDDSMSAGRMALAPEQQIYAKHRGMFFMRLS